MTLVVESRVGESPSSSTPRSVLQKDWCSLSGGVSSKGAGYWGWLRCVGVGDSSGGQVGSGMGWWCLLGFSPVVFFRCLRRSQPQ